MCVCVFDNHDKMTFVTWNCAGAAVCTPAFAGKLNNVQCLSKQRGCLYLSLHLCVHVLPIWSYVFLTACTPDKFMSICKHVICCVSLAMMGFCFLPGHFVQFHYLNSLQLNHLCFLMSRHTCVCVLYFVGRSDVEEHLTCIIVELV